MCALYHPDPDGCGEASVGPLPRVSGVTPLLHAAAERQRAPGNVSRVTLCHVSSGNVSRVLTDVSHVSRLTCCRHWSSCSGSSTRRGWRRWWPGTGCSTGGRGAASPSPPSSSSSPSPVRCTCTCSPTNHYYSVFSLYMVLSYGFNYFWTPEYNIINVTASQNKKVGEKISLMCQADDFWEWCRRVRPTFIIHKLS